MASPSPTATVVAEQGAAGAEAEATEAALRGASESPSHGGAKHDNAAV